MKVKHQADNIIVVTDVGPPITFPQTYYVAPNFDMYEFNLLQEGVDEWCVKTHGIVNIKLKRWNPTREFEPNFYYFTSRKTIWKLYKKDKVVKEMFYQNKGNEFAGLSGGNYVVIIKDYAETDENFKGIFMHEMGHQFGLHHIKKSFPSIMNSNCGLNSITKWDIMQFCKFYNCQ